MLTKLRGLLKSETAADITAALASIDVVTLRAAVESARQRRADLLLTGTDAQILAAERDIETARLEADRAEAAAKELESRLESATEAERIAALTARQAEIVRERDETVQALRRDYAKHANALASLFDRIATSDRNISRFNRDLPSDSIDAGLHIHATVEPLFLDMMYSPPFGNLANFASIPKAPGVAGYGAGKGR